MTKQSPKGSFGVASDSEAGAPERIVTTASAIADAVAEVVRDYFGYADNDYAIPCDEAVATRLGREVLERVLQAPGEKLHSPNPLRACRGR